MNLENNSGQGKDTPVLDIVKKRFNWGAFLLGWIWGLGNKTYLTLIEIPLTLIPYIGLIINFGLCIWFGIKGNEWAWQNKYFKSVEEFHNNQKNWAIGGIIFQIVFNLIGLLIIGIVAAMTVPTLITNTETQLNNTMIKKEISTANEVVLMSEALENKCQLTSNGLAACFAKRMNTDYVAGNSFKAADGSVWTFNADGNYYIKIDVNGDIKGPNREETDIITIPLYVKKNGYIEIKNEDVEKYLKQ